MEDNVRLYENFPILSKVLNQGIPQNWFGKIAYIIFALLPFALIGGAIDLIIICCYNVGRWALQKLDRFFSRLVNIIIDKFIAKTLAILAFLVTGFFVFFLCYTGTWKDLLNFVSGLF